VKGYTTLFKLVQLNFDLFHSLVSVQCNCGKAACEQEKCLSSVSCCISSRVYFRFLTIHPEISQKIKR